jgi:hypothetical protein
VIEFPWTKNAELEKVPNPPNLPQKTHQFSPTCYPKLHFKFPLQCVYKKNTLFFPMFFEAYYEIELQAEQKKATKKTFINAFC